jgi:hypothetical protein
MSKSPRFEIDYETSDRITVLNLKDTMNYMLQENKKLITKRLSELQDHEKSDYEYNTKMAAHIREVLKHYGA